jgi:molybdenum cofactor cytidylyltransferase
MTSRPVVVVLGAGRGSRFDASRHKLAQSLGATTVLGSTLAHAVASQLNVVAVVTPALAAEACRFVASRDVVVLPEVGSDRSLPLGMGFSIANGVSARPDASGWLVMPGDMPLVRPDTMRAVADALQDHPVAYAQHLGRRGHPVGFGSELYSELATLSGDDGARRLVARYPAMGVEVDDPGVLVDVDTERDLALLRGAQGDAPEQRV